MDRQTLETTLQDQAKAPRVTLADVEGAITSVHYFTAREGVEGTYVGGVEDECVQDSESLKLLTMCVIVDKYGFTFLGSSACASPENYNRAMGEKIAYDRAFNQMWMPMGYYLKRSMANTQPAQTPVETTYVDRMKTEEQQLDEKLQGLASFLSGETFTSLPSMKQTLLRQQHEAMKEYLEVLRDRIALE